METLIWPTINVLTLAGILGYFLRKPAKEYVSTRKTAIETELKAAYEMKSDVERKLQELERKLKRLDAEAATVVESARRESARAAEEALKRANALAETIRKDAEISAGDSIEQLKNEVIAELGSALVDKVEAQIRQRLTPQERKQIQAEQTKTLGGSV